MLVELLIRLNQVLAFLLPTAPHQNFQKVIGKVYCSCLCCIFRDEFLSSVDKITRFGEWS